MNTSKILMDVLKKQKSSSVIKSLKDRITNYSRNVLKRTPRHKCVLIVFLIISSYYGMEYVILNEPAPFYVTGILRITMSKFLFLYDWQQLKNEKCLINNFLKEKPVDYSIDCTFCEAIQSVPEEANWTPEDIRDMYLKNHIPVILKNTNVYNFTANDFFDSLIQNYILRDVSLCKLHSNAVTDKADILNLLKKSEVLNSFFFHFQLCFFEAVKAFRLIIPRPNFFAEDLYPVQYIWILSSKNYNVAKFKYIQLLERYTAITQLFGSNVIHLKPLRKCEEDCPTLEIILKNNETIIFSSMWELEYIPNTGKENLAVIFETH